MSVERIEKIKIIAAIKTIKKEIARRRDELRKILETLEAEEESIGRGLEELDEAIAILSEFL
jgi:predicted  nucleic acid-binding Zn-ribbon protein